MTSDREMRAVTVDGVAGEVEIALAIPCFILCAMDPQVRNLASIEDVLLSFGHDIAPLFCEIDCVQTHPDRGVFLLQGKWPLREAGGFTGTKSGLRLVGGNPERRDYFRFSFSGVAVSQSN